MLALLEGVLYRLIICLFSISIAESVNGSTAS